jgi:undecaprenyl-diphosphatase
MDKLMTSVTKLGDAGIFWIILTLIFLIIPKMRKTGVIMAAALLTDLLICNVFLKNIVARTRPYDVNTTVELLVEKLRDYSFPSGHTAASFASVTALYLAGERRLWIIALVISCLIAVSRLYLYVHYPTDVLGGIIFGCLSGWIGYHIVKLVEGKKIVR